MTAQRRRWAGEARAKPSYVARSDEERRQQIEALAAQARARRGYDLSPEELEWQRYWLVVEGRAQRGLRALRPGRNATEYRFNPPSGALAVRDGGPGETQLDRIERALSRTRVQLEGLETKVNVVWDHLRHVEEKIDVVSDRVDALQRTIARQDLRLLRLEGKAG